MEWLGRDPRSAVQVRLTFEVSDDDARAARGERLDQRPADAVTASGDDCAAALEIHHASDDSDNTASVPHR